MQSVLCLIAEPGAFPGVQLQKRRCMTCSSRWRYLSGVFRVQEQRRRSCISLAVYWFYRNEIRIACMTYLPLPLLGNYPAAIKLKNCTAYCCVAASAKACLPCRIGLYDIIWLAVPFSIGKQGRNAVFSCLLSCWLGQIGRGHRRLDLL